MNCEQTKQYLNILIDMEINLYIQKYVSDRLKIIYNSLGIKRKINPPKLKKAKVNYINNMIKTGLIFAVTAFVIFFIFKCETFWETFGIFVIIIIPITDSIFSATVGLVGAFIIGPFVAQYCKKKNQIKYDNQYKAELYEYEKLYINEKERMENENELKVKIRKEELLLNYKYNKSKQLLAKLYNYNILNKSYHNNIIAVSSFYQYLIKKQTYCLNVNPITGDKGAYNIYKNEIKQGIIVTQFSQALNDINSIKNQEILQNTIYDANKQITCLLESITLAQLSGERTLIQKYISERTHAEMGYMCVIDSWHLSDNRAI